MRLWMMCCTRCAQIKPYACACPMEKVEVDIFQMPESSRKHEYVIVFIDHLTKWVEVLPVWDQTALTVARRSSYQSPNELLSDRGTNFLSQLIRDIYQLTGTKKPSTIAYYPQCDGLMEQFHQILLDMLTKTSQRSVKYWDSLSYRAS